LMYIWCPRLFIFDFDAHHIVQFIDCLLAL